MSGRVLVAIVRHGKAEAMSATGRDEDRALTARGEAQARYLAEALPRHLGDNVSVRCSRAVRARSTAEPIASAFDRDPDEHEALFVDRPASGVIEVVRQTAASNGGAPVVVVGHNPTLALTVGALTEGVNGSAEMKTGQAYVLAFRSPELITPGAGEVVQVLRSEA